MTPGGSVRNNSAPYMRGKRSQPHYVPVYYVPVHHQHTLRLGEYQLNINIIRYLGKHTLNNIQKISDSFNGTGILEGAK